jgi:uncharacterized protein (TIGR03067 family)
MHVNAFALAAVGLMLLAADGSDDATRKDLEKLQGAWKVEAAQQAGKDVAVDKLSMQGLVVEGDKATFKDPKTSDHDATIKLDASKKPATIDFVNKDGKVLKQGLYQIDGDDLKLAFLSGEKGRPSELASKAGSDVVVLVLKRMKK